MEFSESASWVSVDLTGCDASHFIGTWTFLGGLMKMITPKSADLVRVVLAFLTKAQAHWRL